MALKALLLRKRLDGKQKELEALRAKTEEFETREAELTAAIEEKAGADTGSEEMLTEERQIALALRAADSLSLAADALGGGAPLDVASVDLWDAIRFLGEITGEDATESLIAEVFANFCVGK